MKNEYMWQKVHEAIDALLWTDDPERVGYAFVALGQLNPTQCELEDDDARSHWLIVKGFMDRPGSGVDRAARMTFAEKREFTGALWNLCGHLDREMWSTFGHNQP